MEAGCVLEQKALVLFAVSYFFGSYHVMQWRNDGR